VDRWTFSASACAFRHTLSRLKSLIKGRMLRLASQATPFTFPCAHHPARNVTE